MNNDETFRAIFETQGKQGLLDLAKEARAAAKSFDEVAKSSDGAEAKVKKSTANSGRSFLELGRIIQDTVQGGFGGGINNLEGLATSLGLGAGVAGAATIAGVAFLLAGPPILKFLGSLGASADDLKPVKERLDAVSKALETLAEKTKLTNAETAEYNKLAQQAGKLDKETAANKARLAAMSAQPKDKSPVDKTIGEKVTDVAAGNQEAITDGATPALAKEAGDSYLGAHGDRIGTLARKGDFRTNAESAELRKLRKGYDDAKGGAHLAADELLTKAMGGNVDAARKLISMMPDGALRDDLVKATTSDATKDEARFAAGQVLDNTVGKAARGIGAANQAAREKKASDAKIFAIDHQTDAAKEDKDAKDAADKKASDAETTQFRREANEYKASEDKRKADETARKTKARRDDIYDAVTAGPLDEQAGLAYGTAVTEGYGDGNGPVSPKRAVRDLQTDLTSQIRATPGINASPEDAAAVARRITSEQATAVNSTAQSLVGMGRSVAGATQDMLAALRESANQANQVKAQLDGARRGLQQLRQSQTVYSDRTP